MCGSLASVTQSEVSHIETIAQMYFQRNKPTPEFEKVVLRESPFIGGKKTHAVESWPQQSFLENKRRT